MAPGFLNNFKNSFSAHCVTFLPDGFLENMNGDGFPVPVYAADYSCVLNRLRSWLTMSWVLASRGAASFISESSFMSSVLSVL